MPVSFFRFRSNNRDRPLTVEEVFRLYGSWSGIHDFDFESLAELDTLMVTGVSASTWTTSTVYEGLPPNLSVKYHKTGLRQGIAITEISGGADYMIVTDSSGYPSILSGGNVLHTVPISTPSEADVEVVFQQQVLDDLGENVQHSLALYMNGKEITTHALVGDLTVMDDIRISMAAYGTDLKTYTDIRIPELCEIAEFGTLDPGENAQGGLQRSIEGRYLKYLVRYDGSLRAWRKKTRDLEYTFTVTPNTALSKSIDLPSLITHARMRGAYVEGVYHDPELTSKYMHRFAELDNSMIMTERECEIEAENTVRRSEESAFTIVFPAHWVPILEPEDLVEIAGEQWVLDGFALQGGGGKIMANYAGRKYVWGEDE